MRIKLPTGVYYVGDPSFVLGTRTLALLAPPPEIIDIEGYQVWVCRPVAKTLEDQNGMEYEIKSGLLVVLPVDLIEDPAGEDRGTVLSVLEELEIVHDGGTIMIGSICIVDQ